MGFPAVPEKQLPVTRISSLVMMVLGKSHNGLSLDHITFPHASSPRILSRSDPVNR
jgi:hypothetical protein